MSVMLGMASKDERNQYRNGQAGDQTGTEVYIRSWYDRPWDVVLRWYDGNLANKFASVLSTICKCEKVGYDQNQRTTLWTQCEKIGWNIVRINEISACECDCSSLMAVCARFCGLNVSKDIWTGNLEGAFRATGKVYSLRQADYTKYSKNLEIGDILLNTAHHVGAVVSLGEVAPVVVKKQYAAVINVPLTTLSVRKGPGTSYPLLNVGGDDIKLPKGMVVAFEAESNGWSKLTGVNGWVKTSYLKK